MGFLVPLFAVFLQRRSPPWGIWVRFNVLRAFWANHGDCWHVHNCDLVGLCECVFWGDGIGLPRGGCHVFL